MNRPIFLSLLLLSVCTQGVEISEQGNRLLIENEMFRLTYDLKSGKYSASNLSNDTEVFTDAVFTVDEMGWKQPEGVTRTWDVKNVEDEFGSGKTLSIAEEPNAGYRPVKTLHLSVYDDLPYAVLGFSVRNHRSVPARISRVAFIDKGRFFPKAALVDAQVLRGGAGAEPNRVEDGIGIEAHNNVLVTGKIDGKRQSFVVGGLRYRDFLRYVEINESKNLMTVTAEDPHGKLVAPGETYDAVDTLFLDFSTVDPFESLERYGLAMRAANKADPNPYDFPTLCGWLVSTGSYGEGRPINNSKDLVDQMEIAKKSGILKYTPVAIRLEPDYYCNRNYGDTQQGWWNDEYWAKYGSLTAPYETFGKFCGKLQELGGIPFTYIQSNMPSNDFAAANPEWMLHNDITRLHAEHRHHMPFVKFDFTDPGFQKHTLEVWQRLRKQGLEGIKFDYPESSWCKDGGFEDKSFTTTAAYRKVFELCREGLGPDAYIHERNLGEYGTPRLDVTAGIVDMQRVWGDSSHFEPEMASRMGLRWYKNRSVFGYYPDGKSFKGMDKDARRTMLSLVGLVSGRLELGTSFGRMKPEEQKDLTRLYPVLGGTRSFRPVDMLLPGRKDPTVYSYRISPDWSQIILCNNGEEARTVSAPISGDQADTGSLGHAADSKYLLFDFWNDEFVGEVDGSDAVSRPLEAQQALTYSLHRKKEHPQFLSTNRHIMQGYLDLKEVAWDGEKKRYSGSAKVVGGEPFVIALANNGYQAESVEVSNGKAKILADGEAISRLTIDSEESADVSWSIQWKSE